MIARLVSWCARRHWLVIGAALVLAAGGEIARRSLAGDVIPDLADPQIGVVADWMGHATSEVAARVTAVLTEALQDYDGALVVVAHDRHLLRATADELWIVAEGRVAPFDGDLDDYADWVLKRQRRAPPDSREATRPAEERRAQKRAEADARARRSSARKPLLARQATLEREMDALNVEKRTLDAWLATSDAYAEDAREALKTSLARQGELTWQLARLEAEWLEIAEALEKADQGA